MKENEIDKVSKAIADAIDEQVLNDVIFEECKNRIGRCKMSIEMFNDFFKIKLENPFKIKRIKMIDEYLNHDIVEFIFIHPHLKEKQPGDLIPLYTIHVTRKDDKFNLFFKEQKDDN